jgi:hypothetical protein
LIKDPVRYDKLKNNPYAMIYQPTLHLLSRCCAPSIPKSLSLCKSESMKRYFPISVFIFISFTTDKKIEVKIVIAQILCIDGDRSGNFIRIENAIKEAKAVNAGLIVFPESAVLGWENPEGHTRAFPIPGKDMDRDIVVYTIDL